MTRREQVLIGLVKSERNARMRDLAAQIEKLSFMLEFMADRYEEDGYLVIPCKIEHCEAAWEAR